MLSTTQENFTVGSHAIYCCDVKRTILVNSVLIKLTPTEYRLFLLLLSGEPTSDLDLVRFALRSESVARERENLDKHIDKMRRKIRQMGLDIHRVIKFGYLLLEQDRQSA